MKETQRTKQDPSLEAIFKWMYVVIVPCATNWIIASSRAKDKPSVWIFYFSKKKRKVCSIKLDVSKVFRNWHHYFPNIIFYDKKEDNKVALGYVMYVMLLEKILFEMEGKKSVSINVYHFLHWHMILDIKDKRSKNCCLRRDLKKKLLN